MPRFGYLSYALTGVMTVLVAMSSSPAQTPVQVIAHSGDAAPGTPSGVVFDGFSGMVVNNLGATAFVGALQGTGVTADNDSGLWVGSVNALSLAAREDVFAPGTIGDARFAQFFFPSLNSLGQIEVFAQLRGSGVSAASEFGTWSGLPSSIQLAYRNGDPLPGIDPAFDVSTGAFPVYSNAGHVAFGGVFDDPNLAGSQFGVWAGPPGVIAAVAVPGQQAPGLAAGVTFRSALLPSINPGGQIVYLATIEGAGVTINNDRGIWIRSAGTSAIAVREAATAPGAGSFVGFGEFGQPAINASGAIAFTNTLIGLPVTDSNNRALYAGFPDSLSLVARENGDATGVPAGVVFDDFVDRALIGGSGAVGAQVKLRGTGVTVENDEGIWANPSGLFCKVAREGDAAPDTNASFSVLSAPSINFHGQTVFRGQLSGDGIDPSSDSGIWAVDPFNQLVLVAREGEALRLGPGDDRVLNSFNLVTGSGGQDGRSSSFNAASQLAFDAGFTDGSSAAVIARVGGAARVSDIAPVIGPASVNGYGLATPATAGDIVSVLGDAGYIRFADVAPTSSSVQILLDLGGTDAGIQAAMAEIAAAGDLYGYSFAQLGDGDFQAMLQVPSLGATPQFFYWNILNIGSVDLQRVQFVPEPPVVITLGLALAGLGLRRRRRAARVRRGEDNAK